MKTATRESWEWRALDALQSAGFRRGGARLAVI